MPLGLCRIAFCPTSILRRNIRSEPFIPLRYHMPVGLKMKLDAICRSPDPESLVLRGVIGGEAHGGIRKRECVVMPLENRVVGDALSDSLGCFIFQN